MRIDDRKSDQLRNIDFKLDFIKSSEASVLASFGDTRVLCTATIENNVPKWMKNKGHGWVTAEYGMLPRSTGSRMRREANAGKQSGRTQEIQRLIGRALRAIVNLDALGENQISLDCDVIQADGGTRTASITGAWVALYLCVEKMKQDGLIDGAIMGDGDNDVLRDHIAALSCGIYEGLPVADLDYDEDSVADTDANFVVTGSGALVEIQATAEGAAFSEGEFQDLLALAKSGIADLVALQKQAVGV